MRFPLYLLFRQSPFEKLREHAQKLLKGADEFRRAFACYLDNNCAEFDALHQQVTRTESEADAIKRNIRGHLPRGMLMPVDKYLFLSYLREQDKVMDSIQDTLHWLSYRPEAIPKSMADDFQLLADRAASVVVLVPLMVEQGVKYFRTFSDSDRKEVKRTIVNIRQMEGQSDQIERKLISDIFSQLPQAPAGEFHLVRLVEFMGEISNTAENSGDMMRAMVAK